jgi:hypothetical protein
MNLEPRAIIRLPQREPTPVQQPSAEAIEQALHAKLAELQQMAQRPPPSRQSVLIARLRGKR